MSENQYKAGMQVPSALERCIRPEHVPRLSFLTAEKKQQLSQLLLVHWNRALTHPRESQEFAQAVQTLASLTGQVQKQSQLARERAAQAREQAQAQPSAQTASHPVQAQPAPAAPQGTAGPSAQQTTQANAQAAAAQAAAKLAAAQVASPTTQQPGQDASKTTETQAQRPQAFDWEKFKAEVKDAIENFRPSGELLKQPPEKVASLVESWREKARQCIAQMETANNENQKLQATVANRPAGTSLGEEEKQKIRVAMANIKKNQQAAFNYLSGFVKHAKANSGGSADAAANARPTVANVAQNAAPDPAHIKKEPAESATAGASQASPIASTPTQSSLPSQKPATSQTPVSAAPSVKPEAQRPAATQAPTAQQPRETNNAPQALSHQAALDRARSHTQTTGQSATPISSQMPAQHQPGHPNISRSDSHSQSNFRSGAIKQQLNINPLQPVAMPPARPTLSGGPGGAPGVMSQPGLQKHPGYVLEGEGERVLSEKKLEELVRQVTGSAGGEGSDTLDPEVKETLLDLADEFVDNVISSACRVAKLRSSSTLELRDLQLILERNYNIRVPGYASDELRTVKKIQPSQAWAQKMSAVQAAKVTGGKADI